MTRIRIILALILTFTSVLADRRDDSGPGPSDGSGQGPDTPGTGSSEQSQAVYFPADNNPADYIISEDEFNSFSLTWRGGQVWSDTNTKITVDEASFSGTIYFGHEGNYHTQTNPDGSTTFIAGVPTGDSSNQNSSVDTITITPIGPIPATVYVEVDPPENTLAYAIEEHVPKGWIFVDSTTGFYNSVERVLRIGPLPTDSKTHEYQLLSILGNKTRPTQFDSTISYDGVSEALTSHYSEEQYGIRLSSWIDNETFSADQLWSFGLTGDIGNDYADALPTFTFDQDAEGETRLKVQLTRFILADDIELQIQYSNNLSDWHPVTETAIEILGEHVSDIYNFEVTVPCPKKPEQPTFYRVKVIHNNIGY